MLPLDESVATLESQTAHSTDLSSVTSHLPEALVSPDDTPGVFLYVGNVRMTYA